MNTVFIVMEKGPNGARVSKVFDNAKDAIEWRTDLQGSDAYLDFDSAYQYWVEEWEIA